MCGEVILNINVAPDLDDKDLGILVAEANNLLLGKLLTRLVVRKSSEDDVGLIGVRETSILSSNILIDP